MKIKIVKKGTTNAKPHGYCPVLIDDVVFSTTK